MTEMRAARHIISTLQAAGHTAVLAGGCVRDHLLSHSPKDLDIATSATPDQVESLFKKTVSVGKQFGVIVVLMDGHEFEVATFRSDGSYTDGRRPDSVSFSSMEEDAKRRDLTINGMFRDPVSGHVFDFVDGQVDLERGIIRLIGDPEDRIREDHLRMLRVVRFSSKFGFSIDPQTFEAVKMNAHRVMNVSAERIKAELDKMLLTSKPSVAIELLRESGLLKHFLPEVDCLWDCEQSPKWHSEGNCGIHSMMVLDATREKTDSLDTLWAALLHDIGKPATSVVNEKGNITCHGHDKLGAEMTDAVMRRMKASNDHREMVVSLVADHMKAGVADEMKKATLRKFVAQDNFTELMNLFEADCESSRPADPEREDKKLDGVKLLKEFASTFEEPKALPEPLVTGKDLIALGLKPGPQFGVILDRVSEEQLEGTLSSKDEALEFVKALL